MGELAVVVTELCAPVGLKPFVSAQTTELMRCDRKRPNPHKLNFKLKC